MDKLKILALLVFVAIALYELPQVPAGMVLLIVAIAGIEYWHTKILKRRAKENPIYLP